MKLIKPGVLNKLFLLSKCPNYFGIREDNLFPGYPVGQNT